MITVLGHHIDRAVRFGALKFKKESEFMNVALND